jgi:hypothetical protein
VFELNGFDSCPEESRLGCGSLLVCMRENVLGGYGGVHRVKMMSTSFMTKRDFDLIEVVSAFALR